MFSTQFNSPSISRDQGERFVVDTNCDVFQLTPENTFYLRNNAWLKSADLKGCWVPTGKLPPSLQRLPAAKKGSDVRAKLPRKPTSASAVPEVCVSFEPAELIRLSEQPVFAPVAGTSLLWISNTEGDLFRHKATGAFCYSVAFTLVGSSTHQLMAYAAPTGEVPLCMVHTAAQEASRRITPARANTHAVAPPMDHTNCVVARN